MTRADCQALSKHHHVCWLSIPCPQHKIGGQRIIGVRDGKDIWGQPVHPSAFSHPWFQIIPYIIFSPPGFCIVFTVFTQPQPSPLGNDAGGSIQFLLSREILPLPPVDIRELLCWWSQLRVCRLTGCLPLAWWWAFLDGVEEHSRVMILSKG